MNLTFTDAKILCSSLRHEEELANKKRRWLMQLPSQDSSQSGPKKQKKPKALMTKFLPESFVRKDEVSPYAVKINIKNYKSLFCADQRLNEVQNYMALSDVLLLQNFFQEQWNLAKFHSTLDHLSSHALGILVNLVTNNDTNFERTRPRMKKVIKDHFRDAFSASSNSKLAPTLQLLSEILINPKEFYERQINFPTFDSSSALKSIYMALELLESMPNFALSSLYQKLTGIKVAPRFPPPKSGYNKKLLIDKIKRRCEDLIRVLNEESSMPRTLGKALSVIHLFFKYKTRCADTLLSKFLSFSNANVSLQNLILKALWSLPKATSYQLRYLQSTMCQNLGYNSSQFLADLKRYLMLCLFVCDEMDMQSDIYDVLTVLSGSSSSESSKQESESSKQESESSKKASEIAMETIEEETEAVLSVSIELKKFILHLESRNNNDVMCDGDDDDPEGNTFELNHSDSFFKPVQHLQQQKNEELEIIGESTGGTCDSSTEILLSNTYDGLKHACVEDFTVDQDDLHGFKHIYKGSIDTQPSTDCRDTVIKELCDETSLVSYRIIDHMLDSFLLLEGHDSSVGTKRRLRCQAMPSINFEDSTDNTNIKVLMQSLNEVLPSVAKSCSHRVKKLMKTT